MKGYKLYTDSTSQQRVRGKVLYTHDELTEMTTFQLRNICYRERLVEGLSHRLDREEMIRVILKYLGADEEMFIGPYCEGGFERVKTVMRKYMQASLQGDGGISVPARIVIYPEIAIDKSDGYKVKAPAMFAESNVLLVNDRMELCGILNLRKEEGEAGSFYLAADSSMEWQRTSNRQYSLLFLRKRDSEYIYKAYYQSQALPPIQIQYYKIPLADLDIRELQATDAVLAIDFGTSNTTAGAFLYNGYAQSPSSLDVLNGHIRSNEVNFVKFPDPTYRKLEWSEALPTAVSVADCSDPAAVKYQFGHEALLNIRRSSYSSRASVFQGLKRWVNNYDKPIEVMDSEGNTATVLRQDIIQAYLKHVIQMAEHQFKCKFKNLHFTSPVKMKAPFLQMFSAILPDYRIEKEEALDEGMAVLYNTIADGLERNLFIEGEEYKALVIDCGGGTTDLSSCRFRVEDGHMSYRIAMDATYENGDTHFGGNNITYRIMQFMKIVFADYYTGGRRRVTDIDDLIDIPANDLFREVDANGVEAVYAELERRYQEAEAVIPTAYAMYENRSRDEYYRVRGNFYFLWEIAEEMKQQFFRKTGILRNRFDAEADGSRDNDLQITTMERWFLSVSRSGELKDEYEIPDVVFNIKEITQLIKGDIYEVLRKFLDGFYQDGVLGEYSIIKLTGQSCRIEVFREALKEFVPGRSIEFRQKPAEGRVPELKLACLRGAIRYLNARKAGVIETSITNHAAVIPYSVSAYTHDRRELELISSLERTNRVLGFISRPYHTQEIEFLLRGADGGLRHSYVYHNRTKDYQSVKYEDIQAVYGDKIPQDDTDSIVNGETKYFVFADDNHWGFYVLPIARQNEGLLLGRKELFPFESDRSELDFFDGTK
ncbi:molecular chaperone [Paenibacillus woosongensis]|uniref:Molecular chaperone n=1 Tax=Paenibacillus woosongensis TaxID=307580 RepID=A0A7X2YYU7_9BACL|nr:molecular chaperone [Paenibacillus woosongensis]MUG44343.1 molecular chaperone [Paenibacillus woosongensis]